METQVARLQARRREQAEQAERRKQELDLKHERLHQQQKKLDAARATQLKLKDQAEAERVAARMAAQAAIIEKHRRSASRLAALKQEHRASGLSHCGDQALQRMSRSLADMQVTARESASQAARRLRAKTISEEIKADELEASFPGLAQRDRRASLSL